MEPKADGGHGHHPSITMSPNGDENGSNIASDTLFPKLLKA